MRLAYQDGIVFIQIKDGEMGEGSSDLFNISEWKPSTPVVRDLMEIDESFTMNLDNLRGNDDEVITGRSL